MSLPGKSREPGCEEAAREGANLDMPDTDIHGEQSVQRVALVTGGSRGIGAATALALAERGFHVLISYRNKATRAQEVVQRISATGQLGKASAADITAPGEPARLIAEVADWGHGRLDVLVLNASGGLERKLVAADPLYPQRINRDAQLALVEAAVPIMPMGSSIVFVTSHWAHLYGRVEQLPAYEAVASSKYAGEQALRAQQDALAAVGIRLLVVTGDLIEGTITPKLLERVTPGLSGSRRTAMGTLPTAEDMGRVIAQAATDTSLISGQTLVIGGALESIPRLT
jgi:NAD(P)-dependent dehydrogenase (short-subunit alcohol dehydrogenase family)